MIISFSDEIRQPDPYTSTSKYKKTFLFNLTKTKHKKTKNIININYLIAVVIKMRLLIFFLFSQNG